jgi:hypothetical protein
MEEFKMCFEDYEISNFGNLRRGDKIINGSINNKGYKYFQVQREGKRINKLFHNMVAEQFIGPRPAELVIDHIDRNKLNNNISNLRYITFEENIRNSDRYRVDIQETDKRLRSNILHKECYRRKLAKQGKQIKNRERGIGRLFQNEYNNWRCIIQKNKKKYDKTFKTKEEGEQFLKDIINLD